MLIELEDVTKTYGKVVALRGLSVTLPEGAIGLLGPNGAGKTTMIRTLLGLIAIDSGRRPGPGHGHPHGAAGDPPVRRFRARGRVPVPRDDRGRVRRLRGRAGRHAPHDAMQRAHEVLDYVGLGEARYRRVESYSTGMKQRLKIASAIVHDPRLLILDEPTNGMDPAGRDDVLKLTHDLAHNKGMSLLFSSHLLPDVEAVCDHVMVLGRGRLLAQGRIDELKQPHDLQFELRVKGDQVPFAERLAARGISAEPIDDHLLVLLPPGAVPAAVWETALDAGEQIRSLRPRRSTLEEVFLNALAEKN